MTLIQYLEKVGKVDNSKSTDLPIVIPKAADEHVFESVKKAMITNKKQFILIDDKSELETLIKQYDLPKEYYIIEDESDPILAAKKAIELVKNGKVSAIMKGLLETGTLLKEVVNKETGIKKNDLLTHVALLYVKQLDRVIAITDGGMVLQPDLEETKEIISIAVDAMHAVGIAKPKVAILSASESVIPKLESTLIAKEISDTVKSDNYIVEGPLSFDLSIDEESARTKKYSGEIQGDADVLIAPNIVVGNVLSKSLLYFGQSQMAGIISGAEVPIVLTSRSATADEKYASILFADLVFNSK